MGKSPDDAVPARSRLVAKQRQQQRAGTVPGNRRKPAAGPRLGARGVVDACRRALRRAAPGLAAVAVVGAVATGGYLGYRYLTTSPRFAIASIEVRGNQTLTGDEIRGLLTARIGDNVFTTDVRAEAAALRAEPWIARADVRRELPDTLVVEIEERTAAAVVALDATYLADARGVPFRRCDAGTGGCAVPDAVPVITGLDRDAFAAAVTDGPDAVRAALAAIASWRADPERPAADEVHVDPHGGLVVRTRAGLSIELGSGSDPADLAARLDRFDLAWAHLTADERARARAVHVDHETRADHVIVAFAAAKD
jgi:cell division septal protein FtsQ